MWTARLHIRDRQKLVEEILDKQLEVPFFFSKVSADRVKQDHLRSSEGSVKFKFLNIFVDVLVFFLGGVAMRNQYIWL